MVFDLSCTLAKFQNLNLKMAIQTEEKKVKVKKVKANKRSSAENQPSQVCDSSAAEKSTEVPLIKLEESQMKEALIAFKKLVDLRDSEKKQDLLGSASGEGRKVQISIAAIKLPRVSEAQVRVSFDSHLFFTRRFCLGSQTTSATFHHSSFKRRLLDCQRF